MILASELQLKQLQRKSLKKIQFSTTFELMPPKY